MATISRDDYNHFQVLYRDALGRAIAARQAGDGEAEQKALKEARSWRRRFRNRRVEAPEQRAKRLAHEQAERDALEELRARRAMQHTERAEELANQRAAQVERWKSERDKLVVRAVVSGGLPELGKRR
ncbi:hypothetical protein ABZ915_25805 [Streptomyces sp. NPDC046915]|uniref:hypothetical protein n=1 Tax=Streptomyces sp. NPDC046915 TaxID=3155257 RepID=UPI0033F7E3D8